MVDFRRYFRKYNNNLEKDSTYNNNITDRKKIFDSIIYNAQLILKDESKDINEIHPIFTYIKQFTDMITYETALYSYIKGDYHPDNIIPKVFEARKAHLGESTITYIGLGVEREDLKYYKDSKHKYYPKKTQINLSNFPLILNPWNSDRISSNIMHVANTSNPFDSEKYSFNIKNTFYYPIGVALCNGGNHSQFSCKLKGAGTTYIDSYYDISVLYDYISFDGKKFEYNFPNEQIKIYPLNFKPENDLEFYAGILFEIGRLLLEYPDIFPVEIKKTINESSYISE